LYPALLALLPMLVGLVATSVFGKPIATQLLALSGACGVAYLLANISRMLGKAQESKLFDTWGGTPTTQLLRHKNTFIDSHTKQRYHAFLARKIRIEFPTSEQEQASPEVADEIYRAGVKWLLGKTRDRKRFFLLFKENVSYGFHRNGFGLRWVGGLIGLLSVAWMGVAFQALDSQRREALPTEQIVTIGIVLAITLAWIAYFNETRVKQASHAYADMLLRACDDLR
jgi:positive regulator of sigma E activity